MPEMTTKSRSLHDIFLDILETGSELEKLIERDDEPLLVFISKPVKCPRCGKLVTDLTEREFTTEMGFCLGCDHVGGDLHE